MVAPIRPPPLPASRLAVCCSRARHFGRPIRSSPETSLLFLHRLGERTRHLVDRIDGLAAQDVNARLARLLQTRQQAVGPGVPFTLGRTQLETAEELGTVREVVVRALRELRQDGIIQSAGRGRYLVRDARRLARLIPV